MSLRFDWYPNYQHEVIISRSDLIVDRLITKGMAQKTKGDLKRTTQQILSALYSAYTFLPKGTTSVINLITIWSLLWTPQSRPASPVFK